jgi:hypothetical protein
MSKRPFAIGAVSAWVGLLLLVYGPAMVPLLTGLTRESGGWYSFALLIYAAFVIYVAVGLFQLRSPHVWLSIALSAWLAVSAAAGLLKLVAAGGPPRPMATASVIMLVNSVVVWYLLRPSFRTKATEYRRERDQDSACRRAEKMLRRHP